MINLENISEPEERLNCWWGNHFIPQDLTVGYWPTRLEYERIVGHIHTKPYIERRSKLYKDDFFKVYVRFFKSWEYFEWMRDNFLSYTENYTVEVTHELISQAMTVFEEDVILPWTETDEFNESIEFLKEKYAKK